MAGYVYGRGAEGERIYDPDAWREYSTEANRRAYSSPSNPTPSGSNFGNTVTGAQDIYSKEPPGPDPSLFTINPGGGAAGQGQVWMAPPGNYGDGSDQTSGGGSGEKPWWYSGADTYESEVAKMGQPSTNMGGTPSGGSYGSSGRGMTPAQAYEQKWAEQFSAANTEWERRFNLEKNKVTTTTPVAPPGDMPAMGEAPTFAAPVRDQARIKELTSQKSAAGLRAMRAQIQKAMGQGYRNPNVKRMTLRDALAGYGQGIESVMTGAQTAASGEYQTEYASAYDVAAKNWQMAYQGKMQDWTNKVNDYFKKYGTQTTTT